MANPETSMIVGKGGREDALRRAHVRSKQIDRVVVAPGNDFMTLDQNKEVIIEPTDLTDSARLIEIAKKYQPSIIEVAQDDALAAGVADRLREAGFRTFGVSAAAAILEADKTWARELMVQEGIRVPFFRFCSTSDDAWQYLRKRYFEDSGDHLFLKLPCLHAGKGVSDSRNLSQAATELDRLTQMAGEGEGILIEDAIYDHEADAPGEEFSYFGYSDGENLLYLKSAQDNKRLYDGDHGPNTGGMGAVARALVTEHRERDIQDEIMQPLVDGMTRQGRRLEGVVYLGGMALPGGGEVPVEVNVRPGDPEFQVLGPGIESDYVELIKRGAEGGFGDYELIEDEEARVCVVGTSPGYPDMARTGLEITGISRAMQVSGVEIFSAAIKIEDGKFYSDGGRFINVVGKGRDAAGAQIAAYEAMSYLGLKTGNGDPVEIVKRKDIAHRDVARLREAA